MPANALDFTDIANSARMMRIAYPENIFKLQSRNVLTNLLGLCLAFVLSSGLHGFAKYLDRDSLLAENVRINVVVPQIGVILQKVHCMSNSFDTISPELTMQQC